MPCQLLPSRDPCGACCLPHHPLHWGCFLNTSALVRAPRSGPCTPLATLCGPRAIHVHVGARGLCPSVWCCPAPGRPLRGSRVECLGAGSAVTRHGLRGSGSQACTHLPSSVALLPGPEVLLREAPHAHRSSFKRLVTAAGASRLQNHKCQQPEGQRAGCSLATSEERVLARFETDAFNSFFRLSVFLRS